MNRREWPTTDNTKPTCVGTGLVALDVVINGNPESASRLWAGGSCANVLTILSYLGWESYPIARLRSDNAARELLRDLTRWKVKTRLISHDSSSYTPIIIEKIGTDRNGIPSHRFELVCPNCGSWLPKYGPVLAKDVQAVAKRMPKPQVFYFDRVARSAVELAKISKMHGALVVFEPSAIRDETLFCECLEVADIVKYSNQRLSHGMLPTKDIRVPLEIETLGAKGLRYRLSSEGELTTDWRSMKAFSVSNLKDAAGSGDWCSAGIIHLLGSDGRKGFENASTEDMHVALSFGQALAALNCYYEGPRGSMYSISRRKFQATVRHIWNDTESLKLKERNKAFATLYDIGDICPNCMKSTAEK